MLKKKVNPTDLSDLPFRSKEVASQNIFSPDDKWESKGQGWWEKQCTVHVFCM